MPANKGSSHIPAVAAIPDGKYPELDKDISQGYNPSKLLHEAIEKIEDLEARVSALETP